VNNNRRLNRVERQRLSLALWLALGSIFLSVVLSATVVLTSASERKRTDIIALQTLNALCSFKSDLAKRAATTERFINDVERGERGLIPGITLADLARSLFAQRSTLRSLESLNC
jgi:Tfp pilus assembly protein PilN